MQAGSGLARFSGKGCVILCKSHRAAREPGAGRSPARVGRTGHASGRRSCSQAAGSTLRSSSRDGTPVALGNLGLLGAAAVCRGPPHR